MPPYRLILILIGCVGIPTLMTLSTLLHAHPRENPASESSPDVSKSSFRTFFSFHTPSTLFPPSAIISLTDDNSTFFLARPADFGPPLAADGLSGQLWTGNGFGDSGHGGAESFIEGELGCSDISGWEDASPQNRRDPAVSEIASSSPSTGVHRRTLDGTKTRKPLSKAAVKELLDTTEPDEEDGTDDHLHHPLPSSPVSKPALPGQPSAQEQSLHGDIQSLQESAEISGKVVLLSRGGCGFLEKVKWAQRRGAVALIVGDNTRGGALVTMYARGDTSNVSIPAVFTSHTTAHLLASLIPPETSSVSAEGVRSDASKPGSGRHDAAKFDYDKMAFTPVAGPKSTLRPSANLKNTQSNLRATKGQAEDDAKPNWLKSLFGSGQSFRLSELPKDYTRPPSSGRLDWLTPKWSDKANKDAASSKKKDKEKMHALDKETHRTGSHSNSKDDFEIGVQDWRDPDLVAAKSSTVQSSTSSTLQAPASTASLLSKSSKEREHDHGVDQVLSGGSITPGSGQYHKPDPMAEKPAKEAEKSLKGDSKKHDILGTDGLKASKGTVSPSQHHEQTADGHGGLWVTITPTTMSTSPFFDTLLVLVVSPLVTLTVVYALLLLRSRIRRRRWRAPKSVVDRLPIRTYQTMSCSSTSSSTRLSSPVISSPTTPRHESSLSVNGQARPRSATASGIGDAISASLERDSHHAALHEKARNMPNKKKYSGRQVECVVCLEEYVEGKSKVMSLPCGHEFHAECITPWLTTRRRTCPICKGDVVRSLAHASSTGPAMEASTRADRIRAADVQTQAAESANDSPTAAIPIPHVGDLENGDDLAATLVNDQSESPMPSRRHRWNGLASLSLSAFGGHAAWRESREAREDRSR